MFKRWFYLAKLKSLSYDFIMHESSNALALLNFISLQLINYAPTQAQTSSLIMLLNSQYNFLNQLALLQLNYCALILPAKKSSASLQQLLQGENIRSALKNNIMICYPEIMQLALRNILFISNNTYTLKITEVNNYHCLNFVVPKYHLTQLKKLLLKITRLVCARSCYTFHFKNNHFKIYWYA